jgi:hypothetical protein
MTLPSESATITWGSVRAEDLEIVRVPRKSHFTVRHRPTGIIAERPVLPLTLEQAKWHNAVTLDKRYRTVKGITGWISSVNRENHVVFLVSVRGGNEYLKALAADVEALRQSFDPPLTKRGRPMKRNVDDSRRNGPLPDNFTVNIRDEEKIFKQLESM